MPKSKPKQFHKVLDDRSTEVDLALLADAVASQAGGQKLSSRERMIVGVIAAMLGAGGTGGVLTATIDMIRAPSPEVIARLDKMENAVFDGETNRITILEGGQQGLKDGQKAIAETARETFDIVNEAHPPRGRFGVPEHEPK